MVETKGPDTYNRIAGLFHSYADYMNSELWKEKADYLKKKKGCCQKCGLSKILLYKRLSGKRLRFISARKLPLYVHHISYENVGNENESDLMVLCDRCHKEVHGLEYVEQEMIGYIQVKE